MTITSTGPSGFHIKPVVTLLAAVAIAAGVFAIAQTIGADSPQSAPAPAELSAEAVAPHAEPSGSSTAVHPGGHLIEGLGDGSPADAGETPAARQPVPEIVVIEGQGSLYDPLIEGKYDPDSAVQYVLAPEAATSASSQLVEGLGDGPFAERPPTAGNADKTPTVSGGPQE